MGLVSSIAAGLEVRSGSGVLVPGAAVTITGAPAFQLSGGLTAAGNVPAITLANVAGLSGSWSTSGGAESRKVKQNKTKKKQNKTKQLFCFQAFEKIFLYFFFFSSFFFFWNMSSGDDQRLVGRVQ